MWMVQRTPGRRPTASHKGTSIGRLAGPVAALPVAQSGGALSHAPVQRCWWPMMSILEYPDGRSATGERRTGP